jgi:glycerophosphoryl diester phosphodiesterase
LRAAGSRFASLALASAIAATAGCAPDPGTPAAAPPLVIAHRGASGLAPEHTFAAYDLAIEVGADYIEQDLQLTRDGVVVVLHDETLDRTARGPEESCTGPVRDRTLAELQICDFGLWFDARRPGSGTAFAGQGIVTLGSLFERYGRSVRYYLETKHPEHSPGMEQALLALLEVHDLLPRAGEEPGLIIQSFSSESLSEIHQRSPGLPLVRLLDEGELGAAPDEMLAEMARYAAGIGPHHLDVDAELVAAARRNGLVVHPYTANTRLEMDRLLDLGVDGLFTDHPERLVEVLRERRDGLRGNGEVPSPGHPPTVPASPTSVRSSGASRIDPP